jgi:rsbT co-antagonist protein RsbR
MNAETAERLRRHLEENRAQIMDAWVDITAGQVRGRVTRSELQTDQQAILDEIVAGLGSGGDGDLGSEAFDGLRSLLGELSRNRARQSFSATETCFAVFALKEAAFGVDSSSLGLDDVIALSHLVDQLGLHTFETYAATRERIIADQSEQLLELSTPVVKLWDGIVAVPLVGTLDSARTQVVMEALLEAIVETGSEHAIIDITGVPAVDTQVAQHLLKTVVAARLMGAECIISGIRPQIALTIVALGIEFGDIATKATLADALTSALQATGATIVRRS